MAKINYGYDPNRFKTQGFGAPKSNWDMIPEGWQDRQGVGGGAASAGVSAAASAVPGVGWGTFAAQQGLGLVGKGLSYMFGGQRKEQKEAKGDYKKDRARIEGSMDETPYSLGEFNTFVTRGMHNYRSTVAKQIGDIADINATDVQGALGEAGAEYGQNQLMDAFTQARMARFENRANSRRALLQSSMQRYLAAQG
ncbi:MAG: hypothetical protein ABIH23_14545 [bacterium]